MEQISYIKINTNSVSLRQKLIIAFILFFLIIASSYLYLRVGYRYSNNFVQEFLNKNQKLNILGKKLQTLLFYTESYISSGRPNDLENLNNNIKEIDLLLKNKLSKYDSLTNIISNIIKDTRKTVNSPDNYVNSHNLLITEVTLCQKYINKIINNNTENLSNKSQFITRYLNKIEKKAFLLSFITAFSALIFIFYFSINITKPLHNIIKNARQISQGNFNIKNIQVNTKDELKSIANVFNQMVDDIKELIRKLEEKIGLERELQKEKVANLRMNSLLREAELKRLQSQINPHFLYNTLNTITQVAILEGADKTGDLIKKIASLLRYNLKQANKMVSLEKEIESIHLYCDIMKIRFSDRLKIRLIYPQELEDINIPGMMLQPLIENSIIHGLKDIDKYGIITIKISKQNKYLEIRVIDNGCGISKEKINKLLTKEDISGLRNIKERLELYYRDTNLLKIKSKEDKFTEIIIKIPLE